ncbi:MAG: hypothetical protein UY26_C0004G0004 [Candidatus Jorgensenbacteria bacterium GW2011_GWA1_48_13]|uniref:LTD domain-containing protein n=2 Tax=Candidatus Joergenseniibacteriota TaxID=1752739 RepID=A0A0G1W7L0_9BACT|nr:MAG: hypothetical protein UY26_C0004G0004 [Candidatus Jorgensenbacteria bacterium GW2011_GWA1_48_13]KKU98583.1 MAG: hypothetical protein UY32_C0021G0004 [Candidatus Jorgensenbacteria bacterium GW2011_GWC1_48_8]KKW14751.1 MAG: hypothetical protein UY55_C0004G0004 [Candidatus Jorgensenbacteria bacterium GW2011_GWB1_50_10]
MKGAAILIGLLIIVAVLYFTGDWVTGQIDFKRVFGPVYNKETAPQIPLIEPGKSGITTGAGKTESGGYYVGFERESPLDQPPEGFTKEQLSPYYRLLELTSVVRPPSSGFGGRFTIRTASALKEFIDITNWRVRSNKGEIVIYGAPGGAGPVNQLNIVLRPGTSATVYSIRSSFVKNVELNKCTGYLNKTYSFNPQLPNNCPRPDRSNIYTFSGACQSFILSLSACEQPTGEELNRFSSENDAACREFLNQLNYQNCYNEHSAESDFFRYGLRIWLEQVLPFSSEHDRLLLLDRNGLLVDIYTY